MSFQKNSRPSVTIGLAEWSVGLVPSAEDLALADRALLDTVAVGLAARDEPILDMPSTTPISTVCVPVAPSLGGGARGDLAGAGVMARMGMALDWQHYAPGWHATAGGIGAAAAVALGLDADGIGRAMALAVPAAGGLQRSFGSAGTSLEIGFAAHAGVRAARLAAAGASADPYAVDEWIALLGDSAEQVVLSGPAIPDGLAAKLYPCCYALQRPIGAAAALRAEGVDVSSIRRIVVRTPKVTVKPLIHSRPADRPGGQVQPGVRRRDRAARARRGRAERRRRPAAHRAGRGRAAHRRRVRRSILAYPPGSPQSPATGADLRLKVADCLTGIPVQPDDMTWASAADLLRTHLTQQGD